MKIVISQPMFFPWPGIFEQMKLADIFVHYDDVQFPQGRSFINRVQIKTSGGRPWLTVPVKSGHGLISETCTDETQTWRAKHLKTLRHAYARAAYFEEMMALVEPIYALKTRSLAEINIAALETVARHLELSARFVKSSQFPTSARSSQRLLDIVKELGGNCYITGHGARNYLDHGLFESNGVRVEYMDYQKTPYPQLHGAFTPFVSILDAIANQGAAARDILVSQTVGWKEFIA